MTVNEVARDIQRRIEANYGQPIDGYIVTSTQFDELQKDFEAMRGLVWCPSLVKRELNILGVKIIPMAVAS